MRRVTIEEWSDEPTIDAGRSEEGVASVRVRWHRSHVRLIPDDVDSNGGTA